MFFNIVAHDLKNPFNSLIGVLQELETNFNTISEEEKKHLIGLLLNASIHAHQFVANLLEWGLSQSGHMQVDLKLVSAKSIINSCVAIHQEQYLLKEVDLQIALSEEDVVFADYNMLHTILRNFINNAIKYTTKGGQIIIKTEAIRNYLRIQVEDDGLGIKAEDVELIFSIVSKLKTDGTAAEKGSGLGLKIVSEFAQKMNAKTGVQSVYGGGSKFWIDVPLNK
jgi:signal transduction histidine kinase